MSFNGIPRNRAISHGFPDPTRITRLVIEVLDSLRIPDELLERARRDADIDSVNDQDSPSVPNTDDSKVSP